MAAAQGRVAVVGGGLAGCLGALILRSRGLRPTIFDAGRRSPGGRLLGGRQPDSGVQFLRASEPRFAAIMHMLAGEGLVAPWRGRFGLLGSQGGGFLPADTLASTPIGSMMREATSEGGGGGGSVDFCGFVGGMKEHPAYVGTPSNAGVLPGLCTAAGIEVVLGAKVSGIESAAGEQSVPSWRLLVDGADAPAEPFDAVLLASHDASLAASVLREAVLPKVTEDELARERLSQLADALHAQRHERTAAVFTWSGYFASGTSAAVPFDAVCVPGSRVVRFLSRDASKPDRAPLVPLPNEPSRSAELWTAVSTDEFASAMLAQESLERGESGDSDRGGGTAAAAAEAMSSEVAKLLAPYTGDGDGARPLAAVAKRWGAGFAAGTLGLQEPCVTLEPWRLAISGDFVSEGTSPAESAALSGMEAAERIASWLE